MSLGVPAAGREEGKNNEDRQRRCQRWEHDAGRHHSDNWHSRRKNVARNDGGRSDQDMVHWVHHSLHDRGHEVLIENERKSKDYDNWMDQVG